MKMDLHFLGTYDKLSTSKNTDKCESKLLRSKSLSCLNIKEFNKVDQTIKNEPFDAKAECSIYSNSKLLMCTEFKNVKSQDQINKFNETQLNQNHFRNRKTNIKNEDEIEN